jgi:flavin reductase (DIM6/NTAB) family NADH-FMN oxidoreductase RutF
MLSIDPMAIATKDLHQFMVSSVAPRPIAWASTVDEDGNPNLAPYSFFNAFSSTKDTLHNIEKTREVVINVVSYNVVRQMAVTGVEFPSDVNEFEKAGVTMLASDLVKPFRVKESPVQFECKVSDIIPLGDGGGAGHLIICNVVRLHIDENVLDENKRIDPLKIDLMGRMGRTYYTRSSGESLISIAQAQNEMVIGFDALPKSVQQSTVLTGNEIGQLAGLKQMPTEEELLDFRINNDEIKTILAGENQLENLHIFAQKALRKNEVGAAAKAVFL